MKIGITGHQDRPGIDWAWVAKHIASILCKNIPVTGLSSLAAGSDQVFAEQVLLIGGQLVSVIPIPVCRYRNYFQAASLKRFDELLAQSTVRQMSPNEVDDRKAFLEAGLLIAKETELLIAIWDGKPARGIGGTGDIVKQAREDRKRVLHINPLEMSLAEL